MHKIVHFLKKCHFNDAQGKDALQINHGPTRLQQMKRFVKVRVVTLLEGLFCSLTYCGPPVKGKFFMQLSGFAEISIEYNKDISRFKEYFANACIMAMKLFQVTIFQ